MSLENLQSTTMIGLHIFVIEYDDCLHSYVGNEHLVHYLDLDCIVGSGLCTDTSKFAVAPGLARATPMFPIRLLTLIH